MEVNGDQKWAPQTFKYQTKQNRKITAQNKNKTKEYDTIQNKIENQHTKNTTKTKQLNETKTKSR